MEDKMTALKSLTFTTMPVMGGNPTLDRRANVIARLEEQKLLLNDPNYTRPVRTWVKKDGQRTPVDKQQRVLPWWRVNANGLTAFFIRSGWKLVEFEKGKAAIAVPSRASASGLMFGRRHVTTIPSCGARHMSPYKSEDADPTDPDTSHPLPFTKLAADFFLRVRAPSYPRIDIRCPIN
jgi:SOS-response transcriptional repressor LexA